MQGINTTLDKTDLTELTADIADVWKVSYYEDDFGKPTSDWFISTDTYITGKFSNSATTDSLLYTTIFVDADDVSIFLIEYGRNYVKNSGRYDTDYNIKMRTADGTVYDMTGSIFPGADRIIVDKKYKDTIITALCGSGDIDFYIVQADRTTTTYSFTATAADFAEEYQAMK